MRENFAYKLPAWLIACATSWEDEMDGLEMCTQNSPERGIGRAPDGAIWCRICQKTENDNIRPLNSSTHVHTCAPTSNIRLIASISAPGVCPPSRRSRLRSA